jgi:hypothetical protein
MHPVTSRVKLGSHCLDILPALNKDFWVCLQHVEGFARSGCEHGRESSGVRVCCCCDTLMSYDVCSAGAESTAGTERSCEGTNDHVNLGGIDVLGFGQTTAGSSKHTKRPCLIKHKTELIAEFKLDLKIVRQSN